MISNIVYISNGDEECEFTEFPLEDFHRRYGFYEYPNDLHKYYDDVYWIAIL